MPTLRLLSYNVRSLRDDADAVTRVIRACRPHVVAVQEAPRLLRSRARCSWLAHASGLMVVAGGRPAAGNLLLSTMQVEVVGTRTVLFTKDRGLHQRGAALAVLSLAGSRFAVAGTHLDLVEQPRLRHVRELHQTLDEWLPDGVPAVIAGDVNDRPGSPCWALLGERRRDVWDAVGYGDGFTYSADEPRRRIDGVFVDARIRPVAAAVPESSDVRIASDHRPVHVELELP